MTNEEKLEVIGELLFNVYKLNINWDNYTFSQFINPTIRKIFCRWYDAYFKKALQLIYGICPECEGKEILTIQNGLMMRENNCFFCNNYGFNIAKVKNNE